MQNLKKKTNKNPLNTISVVYQGFRYYLEVPDVGVQVADVLHSRRWRER